MSANGDAARRAELAGFIRSRRAGLRPSDLGLSGGSRRRVPGLRREELAHLADVSVTWLTQIEQAREIHPSRQVLDSLARALHLSDDERVHLRRLGGQHSSPESDRADDPLVPAVLASLVELSEVPAVVGTWWGDYLCWNAGYVALAGFDPTSLPPGRRNWVWANFVGVVPHDHIDGWLERDALLAAELRYEAAADPGHPRLAEVVAVVSEASEHFRLLWSTQDVMHSPLDGTVSRYHIGDRTIAVRHLQLQSPRYPAIRIRYFVPVSDTDRAALHCHFEPLEREILDPSTCHHRPIGRGGLASGAEKP